MKVLPPIDDVAPRNNQHVGKYSERSRSAEFGSVCPHTGPIIGAKRRVRIRAREDVAAIIGRKKSGLNSGRIRTIRAELWVRGRSI